jgi:putative transcriptional regulator
MAIVRKTLKDVHASQARLAADEEARLDAMTSEEIERAAETDPECPPATDEQLERGVFGRLVRQTRLTLDMSQEQFAAALQIPLPTLRNWEQGRSTPDPAGRALMKIVAADPKRALRALAA